MEKRNKVTRDQDRKKFKPKVEVAKIGSYGLGF
jgi:hypothetical protein